MLNIRFIIKMLGMMFILETLFMLAATAVAFYMKEMTSIRFFSRVVSCSERESFLC